MVRNCGERLLLGMVLMRQGAVTRRDLERALASQFETGKRLGQVLLELRAVTGAALDRALAVQSGIEPELERGYGTGLRAALEERHRLRLGSA
jgi:hypothetical protein